MTYQQVLNLRMRLRELYDEGDIDIWLDSPQKLLGGKAPMDCDYAEVSTLLAQLEDGAYI
jgi:hypothetical protein